jgi:phage portal protein BeeE
MSWLSYFRAADPAVQLLARPVASAAIQTSAQAPVEQRSDDPWDWAQGFSGSSLAGPDVSPLNALSCPPVLSCVNLIAGILGTTPASLFQAAAGGGKSVATDHLGLALIADDANGWTAAGAVRVLLTIDAMLTGTGSVMRPSHATPTATRPSFIASCRPA